MALCGPPSIEGHLMVAPGHHQVEDPAAGVNYVVEHPAEEGLPEVVMILDDDENPPIYISSDEEEDDEVEGDSEGEGIPPIPDGDGDEDEDDEPTDDSSDWDDWEEWGEEWGDSVSEDSGYDTMDEDLEDEEAVDAEIEDVRPDSPLVQQLPPWQGWRVPVVAPVAVPRVFVPDQDLSEMEVEESVPQRSEEAGPSTSGLSSSVKRSREDSFPEQVSSKRQRGSYEENPEESPPSTSGLSQLNTEVNYRESAPSASGLSVFTNRNGEDSYRGSAPSTSGLGSFGNRRYWERPFGYPAADDSDSD